VDELIGIGTWYLSSTILLSQAILFTTLSIGAKKALFDFFRE
jgi:hypothetical protein